jgi:hypothetical protein
MTNKLFMKTGVIALLAACALLLVQCELFLGNGERYNVKIDLGDSFSAASRGIGSPPVAMASYTVTVTAPDLAMIQKTILPGARYINMYVPEGEDRTIRLDANIDPAVIAASGHEHLLSLAGEVTVDLRPGTVVMCKFVMNEGEMKLLIPDYFAGRFFRVSRLSPLPTDFAASAASIAARDTDYDNTGTIFCVGGAAVQTIDDINDTAAASITTGLAGSATSVTVRNPKTGETGWRIYATDGTNIRWATAGSNGSVTKPGTIGTIYSIEYDNAIEDKDILYVAGSPPGLPAPQIFRYNITDNVTTSGTSARMESPRDILVRSKYVYVTNYPVDPDYYASIEVFDKNTLAFVGSYGTRTTSDDDRRPGYFYGPQFFVAPSNRKIYIVDDGPNMGPPNNANRVIGFDDPSTWAGWETFRAEDVGQPPFRFYEC